VGFTGVQGEISFFSGEGEGVFIFSGRVLSGDGGRGRGARCASGSPAKLGSAAGVARVLDRFRQNQEQKPYHVGHGGVVVGRNLPGLAVEFGIDGYGDVSDGSHGLAFERRQGLIRSIGSVRQGGIILCKTALRASDSARTGRFPPRSPKARDRGHPRYGLYRDEGSGYPPKVRAIPGAQKQGTWGTHLQWLCSLFPAPGQPAIFTSDRM